MPYTVRTPDEKRALLAEWRASGVSMHRFAHDRGVPKSCLLLWLNREDALERKRPDRGSAQSTRFVEVEVVAPTPPEPASATGFVVAVAGTGHHVQVPLGFDASELRRLVSALC